MFLRFRKHGVAFMCENIFHKINSDVPFGSKCYLEKHDDSDAFPARVLFLSKG